MNRFAQLIFILCAVAFGIFCLSLHCSRQNDKLPEFSPQPAAPVIVTRVCTVRVAVPQPVITSSRIERRKFPLAMKDSSEIQKQPNCIDSVTVLAKVESSIYEGDTYRVWVSGIDAALDSIVLFNRCDSVFVPVKQVCKNTRKRWHIGPYVGLGWSPAGVHPSVGVCVSFSVFDW
ncbi:MAG: hypothetical protein K2H47_00105 [Muribaculaceae bacterium]|nr:hypothetical protein [Muribaculaceae bacterium]